MHSAWEARIRRRFDFIERKGNGTQHSHWTSDGVNTYNGTARVISFRTSCVADPQKNSFVSPIWLQLYYDVIFE